MPKYAVAAGRCPGIYDTYSECEAQTKGFPSAKFKKFDTVQEAEQFMQQHCKASSSFLSPNTRSSTRKMNFTSVGSSRIENIHAPQMFQVGRNSSDPTISSIVQKLSHLEEQFNQFASSTNTALEDISKRLTNIENSCVGSMDCNEGGPSKKIKLEEPELSGIDHCTFLRNDKDVVIVYTDGACENNGRKGAKAGIGVWFNHGHALNVSAPLRGPATNNNAEIQAARVAINQAVKAGLRKLCVHTDSRFLINCITEWINKWKKNNWKLVNGDDVKNKVEIVKLDKSLQLLESVEWVYVRGHKGIEGNEMADKLARDGAALYASNVTYSDYSDL